MDTPRTTSTAPSDGALGDTRAGIAQAKTPDAMRIDDGLVWQHERQPQWQPSPPDSNASGTAAIPRNTAAASMATLSPPRSVCAELRTPSGEGSPQEYLSPSPPPPPSMVDPGGNGADEEPWSPRARGPSGPHSPITDSRPRARSSDPFDAIVLAPPALVWTSPTWEDTVSGMSCRRPIGLGDGYDGGHVARSVGHLRPPPVDPDTLLFEREWTFWVQRPCRDGNYTESLVEVNEQPIATVGDLWRHMNYLPSPGSHLSREKGRHPSHPNSSVEGWCFFQHGVRPDWEDPPNRGGARAFFKADYGAKRLDEAWQELVVAVVGEKAWWVDLVVGVKVEAGRRNPRLEVWTRSADPDRMERLRESIIRDLFGEHLAIATKMTSFWKCHGDDGAGDKPGGGRKRGGRRRSAKVRSVASSSGPGSGSGSGSRPRSGSGPGSGSGFPPSPSDSPRAAPMEFSSPLLGRAARHAEESPRKRTAAERDGGNRDARPDPPADRSPARGNGSVAATPTSQEWRKGERSGVGAESVRGDEADNGKGEWHRGVRTGRNADASPGSSPSPSLCPRPHSALKPPDSPRKSRSSRGRRGGTGKRPGRRN